MMYSLARMAEGAATSTFLDSVDFSAVTEMANTVAGKAVPAIVAVLAVTIGIKLLKKFGNKIG